MEPQMAAGSLGPRLAGRLTAELILRSRQYMNCVNHYEINLRGNKIGAIENFGATQNQFDSIDLSDNAVVILDGFPKLPRLKVLLMNNNRITRLGRDLQDQIPNLEMLVLTNNKITQLQALDMLAPLRKLEHLSLVGNPVTKIKNYRLYVIHKLQSLKVLDFSKVKQKERDQARELFGSVTTAATEQQESMEVTDPGRSANDSEASGPAEVEPKPKSGPSKEQLTAIKAAIANAQTLEEVRRLEAALKEGNMPSEIEVGDAKADKAEKGTGDDMEEG